jgi:hypothetical protein
MTTPTINTPKPTDWPVYWFAALERAIEENDWQAAENAKQQLERLGVSVSFHTTREATRDPV